MEESTEQKPHIEKNPQMNSQNSNNSSEKIDSISSGKKLETLPCYNPNSKVPSFSKLLQDVVMAANSSVTLDPSVKTIGFEGKFGPSHQEALAKVTAKASEKDKFSFHSDEHLGDVPRTPKSDGYSWRKYGQKQLKGSGSSRSYYRCTSISCNVKKKVQHVDLSGEVIDVVYKGNHNHDPPQHLRAINQKKDSAPRALHNFSESFVGNVPHSLAIEGGLKHLVPSTHECEDKNMIDAVETSPKDAEEQQSKAINTISSIRCESEPAILQGVEERSGSRSDNSCENAMIDPMKVLEVAPLKKRRLKEKVKVSSEPVYRTFKDPKVVVLADKDAGMSGDGYRWRKYGQKMVKGTPHPRSYYRCSSLGCPVRKHVERATDSSAILVTYEGEHDHDIPTPRRPHNTAENKHVEEQTKDPKGSEARGENAIEPEPSLGPDSKGSETRGGDVSESEPSLGEDQKGSETHGGNVLGSKSSLGEDPKGSETRGDFGLGSSAHIEPEPSLEEDQKGPETREGNVLESERSLGEDQKRSESGGDKVLESARTLLSFGIELKSC